MNRLQGPLVQKVSDGWVVTEVVEYLNLLPYADILLDWFSRYAYSKESNASCYNLIFLEEPMFTKNCWRLCSTSRILVLERGEALDLHEFRFNQLKTF